MMLCVCNVVMAMADCLNNIKNGSLKFMAVQLGKL